MTKKDQATDIEFITALTNLLQENDLTEIQVERDYGGNKSLSVMLSRQTMAAPAPMQAAAPVAAPAIAEQPAAAAPIEDPAQHPGAVTSPMVGTVYLSAEPGAAPFVTVGSSIAEGQTVLIIEAMKTMNQIPAPKSGTITRILVDDATPVEFGSPLVIIE